MLAEQKELYNYTKNHFAEELSRISPECVSPLISVRKVVKKAIYKYVKDYCTYCTNPEDIFSQEDFSEVSNKIHQEIMDGDI